jgi:hypothetical protein
MSFQCPTVYRNCVTIMMGNGLQFIHDPLLQDPEQFFSTYQSIN